MCTILWVPEFLTSQKCVRCEAVGHDKKADRVSFDKHRVGTCPRCGCQQDRDVNAALNQADVVWQWLTDATRPAHLDADWAYKFQRGFDSPGWSTLSPPELTGTPLAGAAAAAAAAAAGSSMDTDLSDAAESELAGHHASDAHGAGAEAQQRPQDDDAASQHAHPRGSQSCGDREPTDTTHRTEAESRLNP